MFAVLVFALSANPVFVVENHCPKFTVTNHIKAAPEVAVKTFRTGEYNKSHQCPSCGQFQWVVSGFNSDGTHNHTCSRCSTQWKH